MPETTTTGDTTATPANAAATPGAASDVRRQVADNSRRRRTRKFAYLAAVISLLIPIIVLGMPASEQNAAGDEADNGGVIARQRHEFGLGEGTLGDIDPASSSMNLMLLGLRGVAANQLWLEAVNQKDRKQWNELEQTTNSIILLQPHFVQVWRFGGWNMAYNVSAEFDADEDRFAWVKKGAKFAKKGTDRNQLASELFHERGDYVGNKIGHSDEWRQFRRFFITDPNEALWDGGPDTDLNPDGIDNYLVAKQLYEQANEVDKMPNSIDQKKMADALFRAYAPRSLYDMAMARQKEGRLDDVTRDWWAKAYDEWVTKYGREKFRQRGYEVQLEMSPEEMAEAADDYGTTLDAFKASQNALMRMTNYSYWKLRGKVEGSPKMAEARRLLLEGKQHFLGLNDTGEQDFDLAEQKLFRGLSLLEDILSITAADGGSLTEQETERSEQQADGDDAEYDANVREQFRREELLVKDIIKSQMMYRFIQQTMKGIDVEEAEVPLQDVWDSNPEIVAEVNVQFERRVGSD